MQFLTVVPSFSQRQHYYVKLLPPTHTLMRSISGPIPGITPKFDSSVDGKFKVQGEDGRVLNLRPKVIREEDVATPPRDGENVKVVPRDEILVSQG